MLSPPSLVDGFRTIMNRLLHGRAVGLQAMVAEFMDEGYFYTHVRRMRRIYAERHDVLCASAKRKLQRAAEGRAGVERTAHDRPSAGGPAGKRACAAAADARQRNRVADRRFTIAPVRTNGLVLGFGGVRPSAIEAGVEVLRGGARGLCQTAPGVRPTDVKTVAGRPVTGLLAAI